MIFDRILHENLYNYGINFKLEKRKKGDEIEFYQIEKYDSQKKYEFAISTKTPLIERPIRKNRLQEPDVVSIWTDSPKKIDDAFDKQMQWHYERIIGLSHIDYNISSMVINPHGIFFYSIGSDLHFNDTKVSSYKFNDSKLVEKNVYWQFDPYKYNFIRKYEI
mgnify:FL=1